MDKGMGRIAPRATATGESVSDKDRVVARESPVPTSRELNHAPQELEGIIRNGVVELLGGQLPEGTRVQVRARR